MSGKNTTPTRTFWSVANEAFSGKERLAFNRFKVDLYEASDRLKSALPVSDLGDVDSAHLVHLRNRANELHDLICKIPFMEK